MQIHRNRELDVDAPPPVGYDAAAVAHVRTFHRQLAGYRVTPLHDLPGLAANLGVGAIWLKDESARFGLKAFKGLGASYALAMIEAAEGGAAGAAGGGVPPTLAGTADRGSDAMQLTLVTATDGNHGRAVAWAARERGHKAVVYVPVAASAERAEMIVALGAEVRRSRGTYDEACREAAQAARANGWVLLQDTATPGYEQIPSWIMQGYATLIDEVVEQLAGVWPTHVFLQCGVGSFAAAITAYLMAQAPQQPTIILVEPNRAACALAAFAAASDTAPLLPGDTHSFMACLSCGQLSTLAWPILRRRADWLLAIDDDVARQGMRQLARPLVDDAPVVSGESGAATAGALLALADPAAGDERAAMGLDGEARVLLISTEGDTDPAIYRETVG